MADQSKSLVVRFVGDTGNLTKGLDGLSGRFKMVTGALGGIAAAGAAIGAISFFKSAIEEAEDAAKVGRQTEAVLKSTGGQAKITADQIGDLATRLSNLSGVDDEVIQSGANVLLTFTKIRNETGKGNDIFDQATAIALDMSKALGTDLQGSVIQVGKALQDPIKGVTALQKVGVSFTQQQRDEIKALVEKGDVLGAQKKILGELQTEFGGMAAASATASEKMSTAWGNFKEAIGTALLPAFTGIADYITNNLLPVNDGAFDSLQARASTAGAFITDKVIPALGSIVQFIRTQLLPAWAGIGGNLKGTFSPVILTIVKDLMPVLLDLVKVFNDILAKAVQAATGWIKDHTEVVYGLVAAYVAFQTVSAVTDIIDGIKIAFDGLSAAMRANPIVLIVSLIAGLVAAFIVLWNKSAAFRDFFIGIWDAIKDAVKWAWENVIKPVVDALVGAWHAVGDALKAVWDSVIHPVIQAFADAGNWLYSNVLQPVFLGIAAAFQFLEPVFSVVGKAINFVFILIAGAAQILWAALKFAFDFIAIAFQTVWAAIEAVWTMVIQPIFIGIGKVFEGVGFLFESVWVTMIKPGLQGFGDFVSFLWNDILQPTFELLGKLFTGIGNVFQFVWDAMIKPVLGKFGDLFDNLGKIVNGTVDFIKTSWEVIGKVFGTPVKFIVDWVWNKGIVAFWNFIADKVGLGKLDTVDTSSWPHFASGGKINGRGGPREDNIPIMASNGEFIMPADKTKKHYPILEAMRSGALPGYADGGVIGNVIDWVGNAIGDAINFVKDPIGSVTRAISTGGQWLTMAAKTPAKLIGDAASWLWNKITVHEASLSGMSPEDWVKYLSGKTNIGSGIIPPNLRVPLITEAMHYVPGAPGGWIPGYLTLIQRESGWNPMAVNNWDSNAARGTPSMGLTQTIMPTFQAFRDKTLSGNVFDPLSNIVASMNYVKSRYGLVIIQQMNPAAPPKGYDSGGWLPPGYTMAYNGTGENELILTGDQARGLRGGGTKVYNLTIVNAGNSEVNLRQQFRNMEILGGE